MTDRCSLLITLRDMHIALARRILSIRGDRGQSAASTRQALALLPVPGILFHSFRYTLICVVYLEGGWYAAKQIGVCDVPLPGDEMFGSKLAAAALAMLRFRVSS